jgi:hypothetical protein
MAAKQDGPGYSGGRGEVGAVTVFAPGSSCYLLLCTYYPTLLIFILTLLLQLPQA